MEAAVKLIILGLLGFGYTQCAVVPVKKCESTDNNCLIEALQTVVPNIVAGISEYGIPVLDPFAMDNIKFNLSGFQFGLTDAIMRGMKGIIIDEAELSLDKQTIYYKFHLDASLKGHYIAEGTLLGQPITGEGEMKIELKNLQIAAFYNYDVTKISGKDHVKIKKYKVDFDVKDNVHYDFSNLFNGNKELSDPTLKFINENWHQFALTFGRPLVDAFTKEVVININKFFKNVPLEDLVYL